MQQVSLLIFALFVAVASAAVQLYNDPVFLDAEIRRIRAGKAGDPIKPPVIRGKTLMHARSSEEYSDEEEGTGDGDGDGESNYGDDYTSSEELAGVTCSPGKGWHFRGQRCVLINCPGGPDQRDFNTGECLRGFQPSGHSGRYRPYSQWNSLNHVYRTHPAQRFLSRGMLSLLRRG